MTAPKPLSSSADRGANTVTVLTVAVPVALGCALLGLTMTGALNEVTQLVDAGSLYVGACPSHES